MKDERKFRDVCHTIKQSANDVDRVNRAARTGENRLSEMHRYELYTNILLLIGFLIGGGMFMAFLLMMR